MIKRRLFLQGMGAITVYSFLPLPMIFDENDQYEALNTLKKGKPEKVHNYAMIIIQDKCIGCRACEVACKTEWHIPKEDPEQYRTKVLYGAEAMSLEGQTQWLPVLCNQCDNAPCVRVCPTRASYKRPEDGIILVEPNKCIGCKTCMIACPYEARYYSEEKHTVDKCTFCQPRLAQGKKPACVESCYKGARVFGDLNDHSSEAYQILKKAVTFHTLKPEEGTLANVFYTQDI